MSPDILIGWWAGAGIIAAMVIAVVVRPPRQVDGGISAAAARSLRAARRAFVALGLLLVGVTAVVMAASLHGTVRLPRSPADSVHFLGALVDTVVHRGRRDSALAERRQRSSRLILSGAVRSDPRARLAAFDSALAVDSTNGYAWWFRADELARDGRCAEARAAAGRAGAIEPAIDGSGPPRGGRAACRGP